MEATTAGSESDGSFVESEMESERGRQLQEQSAELQTWTLKQLILMMVGAGVGSLLEFYCFGLIGYFALELENAYFPASNSNLKSLLEGFVLFGFAFIFRPFGALLFGHISDKHGRVFSLRISIICMVIPSTLFGLMPSYATIGYWSTALALTLRAIQGMAAGGEMSTAMVYVIEESPAALKGTMQGLLWTLSCGGYFSLVVHSLWASAYTEHQLLNVSSDRHSSSISWTWRIPFVCTAFIGIFGYYIRRFLPISHEFQAIADRNQVLRNPIGTVLKEYGRECVLMIFVFTAVDMLYWAITVWTPTYLQSTLHVSPPSDAYAFNVQVGSSLVLILLFPVSGYLVDKYGVYQYAKVALLLTIANTFAVYTCMGFVSNAIALSVLQFLLALNGLSIPVPSIWCLLHISDPRVRTVTIAFAENFGNAVLVATLLDALTSIASADVLFSGMFVAMYLCFFLALSLCAIIYGQTHRQNARRFSEYSEIEAGITTTHNNKSASTAAENMGKRKANESDSDRNPNLLK